jgi:hypothetical protein
LFAGAPAGGPGQVQQFAFNLHEGAFGVPHAGAAADPKIYATLGRVANFVLDGVQHVADGSGAFRDTSFIGASVIHGSAKAHFILTFIPYGKKKIN